MKDFNGMVQKKINDIKNMNLLCAIVVKEPLKLVEPQYGGRFEFDTIE